jgi:hypothetical protein
VVGICGVVAVAFIRRSRGSRGRRLAPMPLSLS